MGDVGVADAVDQAAAIEVVAALTGGFGDIDAVRYRVAVGAEVAEAGFVVAALLGTLRFAQSTGLHGKR